MNGEIENSVQQMETIETNKKKLLDYLLWVQKIVIEASQNIEIKKPEFSAKLSQIYTLATTYIDFLEKHKKELSAEQFGAISKMAKSCLLLNLKTFKQTEEQTLLDFRRQHPDFENLNKPGTQNEPWKDIKTFLYNTKYNNERERLREAILVAATPLIQVQQFHPNNVEHLERFLPTPKGMTLKDSIISYVKEHQSSINEWSSATIEQFEKYLITLISEFLGQRQGLQEHPRLKQLEEEMASIKFEYIQAILGNKAKFLERAKKIKLVRDLRFGRISPQDLKKQIEVREAEITNDPNLKKEFGPLLKNKLDDFIKILIDTKGMPPAERMERLKNHLNTYGESISFDSKRKSLTLLGEKLKLSI